MHTQSQRTVETKPRTTEIDTVWDTKENVTLVTITIPLPFNSKAQAITTELCRALEIHDFEKTTEFIGGNLVYRYKKAELVGVNDLFQARLLDHTLVSQIDLIVEPSSCV